MKILVTGANGFVGRNLVKKLNNHTVTGVTREDLDLCDRDAVNEFFYKHKFDVVIHTAVCGGKRLIQDESEVANNNIKMFYNLMSQIGKFDRLINIGSGAELDRSRNVNKVSRMVDRFPIDPYGMSKNVIARISIGASNVSNIRGFGIFGEDESLDRFVRSNIIRAINGCDILIHQDKLMDFFYIDDLVILIDKVIRCDYSPSNIDCSYDRIYTLHNIAEMIKSICKSSSDILTLNSELGNDYCGHMYSFTDEEIKFIGLQEGIKRIYEHEKNKLYN